VVAHLNQHQSTDFIYSDEDKLELDGTRTNVYFKPDWSPEHFLTNMYTCHLMVVRRALVEREPLEHRDETSHGQLSGGISTVTTVALALTAIRWLEPDRELLQGGGS
jgi:hypothetical protein